MVQHWGKLLFLHWPVPVASLRRLVPAGLEIDTYEGQAYVSVTPFTMWGIRPAFLPAVPLLSRSRELNVRTYVHHGGVPGVWFLSLEASNPVAVAGARLGFHLPYFQARMSLQERGERIRYSSHRTHPGAPGALFEAEWTRTAPRPPAEPRTLDFFLIERYCLYAEYRRRLRRCRIHHRPWSLRGATVHALASTLLEAHGLTTPASPPLVHAQGDDLEVEVWMPAVV